MWTLETPVWELILRGTLIYLFVFFLMRIWGKKHFGQMTPFDFILLLIMSEAVQNGLIGDDKSVIGGAVVLVTFFFWNVLVNKLAFRSQRFEEFVQGKPQVVIKNGTIIEDVKKKEELSDEELDLALRMGGVEDIHQVRKATIETNGNITVIKQ